MKIINKIFYILIVNRMIRQVWLLSFFFSLNYEFIYMLIFVILKQYFKILDFVLKEIMARENPNFCF